MFTERKDIHKPSTFDPAQYAYDGMIYTGARGGDTGIPIMSDYEIEQRQRIAANGYSGNFKKKGTCDHCGAYFHYGAIFKHSGGDLIVVGHICADEAFGHNSRRSYDDARLRREIAGHRKRGKIANQAAAFLADHAGLEEALECDHYISRDLLSKLLQYGCLSEKQVELAMKLPIQTEEHKQREAQEAIECQDAPDWTDGKQSITGIILATKWQENQFGGVLKMLVKLDDGRKCWGSIPSSIRTKNDDKEFRTTEDYRDMRIDFTANFEKSSDDAKFAYFKRPSKAKILNN